MGSLNLLWGNLKIQGFSAMRKSCWALNYGTLLELSSHFESKLERIRTWRRNRPVVGFQVACISRRPKRVADLMRSRKHLDMLSRPIFISSESQGFFDSRFFSQMNIHSCSPLTSGGAQFAHPPMSCWSLTGPAIYYTWHFLFSLFILFSFYRPNCEILAATNSPSEVWEIQRGTVSCIGKEWVRDAGRAPVQ